MNEVVAVCTDLFFAVQIEDVAKRAGTRAKLLKSRESALECARGGAAMVVLDLQCRELDTVDLVRALKTDPTTAPIPVTAFVSHVRADLIREARDAGCDRVLARSSFVKELYSMLTTSPDNASHLSHTSGGVESPGPKTPAIPGPSAST